MKIASIIEIALSFFQKWTPPVVGFSKNIKALMPTEPKFGEFSHTQYVGIGLFFDRFCAF